MPRFKGIKKISGLEMNKAKVFGRNLLRDRTESELFSKVKCVYIVTAT